MSMPTAGQHGARSASDTVAACRALCAVRQSVPSEAERATADTAIKDAIKLLSNLSTARLQKLPVDLMPAHVRAFEMTHVLHASATAHARGSMHTKLARVNSADRLRLQGRDETGMTAATMKLVHRQRQLPMQHGHSVDAGLMHGTVTHPGLVPGAIEYLWRSLALGPASAFFLSLSSGGL